MAPPGQRIDHYHDQVPLSLDRDWEKAGRNHCTGVSPLRRNAQWLVRFIRFVDGLILLAD
jgi:hypothetical protein